MKKILVCDDDPSIVEIIKITLEVHGYSIVTDDGTDLTNKMKLHKPALLLLDLMLANNQDGAEIVKSFKKDSAINKIPIIVVSASSRINEKAAQINAVALVKKPFDLSDLVEVVSKHLQP